MDLASLTYSVVTTSLQSATLQLRAHATAAGQAAVAARNFATAQAQAAGLSAQASRNIGNAAAAGFNQVRTSANNAATSLNMAKQVFLGFSAAISVTEMIKWADQWVRMQGQLAAAGVNLDNIAATQNNIVDLAQKLRIPLTDVANLYTRIFRSTTDIGTSSKDVLRTVEIIGEGLKVSGNTTAEVNSTMIQLSQSLQKGVLNGDELRSILENSYPLTKAIAAEFGVSVGQLQKMGTQGQLVASRVIKAILDSGKEMDAAFKNLPRTVADAWTQVSNELQTYIGKVSQADSATSPLISTLDFVRGHLEGILYVLEAIGAFVTAGFILRMTAAWVAMTGPVGAVVAVIAAVIAAIVIFKDHVITTGNWAITLGDYFKAAFQLIGESLAPVQTWFGFFIALLGELGNAFLAVFNNIAGIIAKNVDFVIGAWVFAFGTIKALWDSFPTIVGDAMANVGNLMLDTMAAVVNKLIEWIHPIAEFFDRAINFVRGTDIKTPDAPIVQFKHFETSGQDAGEIFGTALAQAAGDAFQPYTERLISKIATDAGQVFSDLGGRLGKLAEQNAISRAINELNPSGTPRPGGNGAPPPPGKTTPGEKKFASTLDTIAKETLALKDEADTFGESTYAINKYKIEKQLLLAVEQDHIALTPAVVDSIHKAADAYAKAAERVKQLKDAQQAAEFLGQSLFDAVKGAKSLSDAFKQLAQSILQAVLQATLLGQGPLAGISGTSNGGGLLTQLFSAGLGLIGVPVHHNGGMVGSGGGAMRMVSPLAFIGAQRFHDGGEVPAILQKGERVIPRGGKEGGGDTIVMIENHSGEEVHHSSSKSGGRKLERFQIGGMSTAVQSGQMDSAMLQRFGISPTKRLRGGTR